MLHPASYLFFGVCSLLLAQRLPASVIAYAAGFTSIVALLLAPALFRSVLRRSRWLLLTLFIVFVAMTPGVLLPAPWSLGVLTAEGLRLGLEHVLLLVTMLAILAVLLYSLDQRNIVAGLYVLLRPLSVLGVDRRKISVRLLLILDHLAADRRQWRQLLHIPAASAIASLTLPAVAVRTRDVFAIGALAAVTCYGWLAL